MSSVILFGPGAVTAATELVKGLGVLAWDLGPDFGPPAARIMDIEIVRPERLTELIQHCIDAGWMTVTDFEIRPDGPPFRMGGDVSVVGTQIFA